MVQVAGLRYPSLHRSYGLPLGKHLEKEYTQKAVLPRRRHGTFNSFVILETSSQQSPRSSFHSRHCGLISWRVYVLLAVTPFYDRMPFAHGKEKGVYIFI